MRGIKSFPQLLRFCPLRENIARGDFAISKIAYFLSTQVPTDSNRHFGASGQSLFQFQWKTQQSVSHHATILKLNERWYNFCLTMQKKENSVQVMLFCVWNIVLEKYFFYSRIYCNRPSNTHPNLSKLFSGCIFFRLTKKIFFHNNFKSISENHYFKLKCSMYFIKNLGTRSLLVCVKSQICLQWKNA